MKYVLIMSVLVSCALPQVRSTRAPIIKKADRIERCISHLIGKFEVDAKVAAEICIEVRSKK